MTRLEDLGLGQRRRLEDQPQARVQEAVVPQAMLDVFNTLNVNTVTAQTNRNGSAYLQPTTITAPRVLRLSLKYRF